MLIIVQLIATLFSIPGTAVLLKGPRHLTTCTINGEERLCNWPDSSTFALAIGLSALGFVIFLTLYSREARPRGELGPEGNGPAHDRRHHRPAIGAWRALAGTWR